MIHLATEIDGRDEIFMKIVTKVQELGSQTGKLVFQCLGTLAKIIKRVCGYNYTSLEVGMQTGSYFMLAWEFSLVDLTWLGLWLSMTTDWAYVHETSHSHK